MKGLGKDKALIINTIASLVTFIVGLGIAFFFTPFLTDTVGELSLIHISEPTRH